MLSENEDIERFVNLIEEKIKNKELKKYAKWDKTKNKIKHLKDESEEIKAQQQDDLKNLQQLILAKKPKNFIADLEAKYGGGGKGKKKKQEIEEEYEIDEEEFQRIQQEMMNKNNKKLKK